MTGPRIGSLFSGYGGLEQGVQQVLGGQAVWHSEIDPGACKILAHHYPDVPNLGDITTVDWSQVEPVDVLVGGFPCQDLSAAGLGKGLRPDTRSGLWSRFAYAISQLRPSLVVIENVRGLTFAKAHHPAHSDLEPCPWCVGDGGGVALRALGAVLGDLADIGYDASWQLLRASDVGAPHGRARVFVAAWPDRREGVAGSPQGWHSVRLDERNNTDRRDRGTADADAARVGRRPQGRDDGVRAEGLVPIDWGAYGDAVRRWERVLGRVAPSPTELSAKGSPRLSPRFVEWMMGLPAGWVTDVPGLSRNEQLKALGNGVVPQQAAHAIELLLDRIGCEWWAA